MLTRSRSRQVDEGDFGDHVAAEENIHGEGAQGSAAEDLEDTLASTLEQMQQCVRRVEYDWSEFQRKADERNVETALQVRALQDIIESQKSESQRRFRSFELAVRDIGVRLSGTEEKLQKADAAVARVSEEMRHLQVAQERGLADALEGLVGAVEEVHNQVNRTREDFANKLVELTEERGSQERKSATSNTPIGLLNFAADREEQERKTVKYQRPIQAAPTFDGTKPWEPFHAQFEIVAGLNV